MPKPTRDRIRHLAPKGLDLAANPTVRFFRDLRRFHGGHLKVHDYFDHVAASGTHTPIVTFTRDSLFDDRNPWAQHSTVDVEPPRPDVLFIAGRDWSRVPDDYLRDETIPVINLVQHMRHTDASTDLYSFLARPAVRICVGPELGEAIDATDRAKGPVIVIPNGIDTDGLVTRHASNTRRNELLIVGTKQPDLAGRLHDRLSRSTHRVELLTALLPRGDFLDRLADARVALFLPNPTEGFYLPALEAMALGTLVVCPDCIGNRSFCIDEATALRPEYTEDALVEAAERALRFPEAAHATITQRAMTTSHEHDLATERQRFCELLSRIGDLWA